MKPKNLTQSVYPEAMYGGYSRCDGSVEFQARVQSILPTHGTCLDIGCGRGVAFDDTGSSYRARLHDLRGPTRKVIDVAMARTVLEHVANPHEFLAELHRVLKPGGMFAINTTNLLGYPGTHLRVYSKPVSHRSDFTGAARPRRQSCLPDVVSMQHQVGD